MIIRSCKATDIPMITAIYAEAVNNGVATFEVEPPTAAEMKTRWQGLVTNNYPYLVAEDNGVVVGYAYAGKYHQRLAYAGTVEDSIYIHPDYQGKGIGKILLKHLIEELTKLGFRQIVAVVGDSANHGSISLHLGQGFRIVGTLQAVGWKHGRWIDTVLMQRPLGKADSCPFAAPIKP